MFTSEEPDYEETLKEWISGMGQNHPAFKVFFQGVLKRKQQQDDYDGREMDT